MGSDRTIGLTSGKGEGLWARLRPWLDWAFLLAWMALIYRLSATPDLKTVPLAQRFHLLPAAIGVELTNLLELLLRKAAHMAAFGLLAWLGHRALAGTFRTWSRARLLAAALALTVLYAISDEWHQTFVPTRYGSPRDVAIDTAGALIALASIWFRSRRRPAS
ncbi:MAG TPA: VanZ family protein [Symbiobacteriaceae bacterium]|nr:VanZ family protein [Symbiobacteriaceae bacterium]